MFTSIKDISYIHYTKYFPQKNKKAKNWLLNLMATRKGLEPPTFSSGSYCSIQLSYRAFYTHEQSGDPEGIRTPDRRLRKPWLYPAELPGLKRKSQLSDSN